MTQQSKAYYAVGAVGQTVSAKERESESDHGTYQKHNKMFLMETAGETTGE